MNRLYLVRHGIAAEPADFSGPDTWRPLTPKGRRRFRRLARELARLEDPTGPTPLPTLVVSSPLVRAVQTAELLAAALRVDTIEIHPDLTPEGDGVRLLRWLATWLEEGQGVALVGHDPSISWLLAHLAELSPRDAGRVRFRKGCIVRIDVAALPAVKDSQSRWWLSPKTRALRTGLPLERLPEEKRAAAERKAAKKAALAAAPKVGAGAVEKKPAPESAAAPRASQPRLVPVKPAKK